MSTTLGTLPADAVGTNALALSTDIFRRGAEGAREGPQRNFDAGRELGDLALPIEIEIFHLPVGEFLRELAEHSRHVEVRAPRPRHDLVDLDLQHVAGLRPGDEDRPGDG